MDILPCGYVVSKWNHLVLKECNFKEDIIHMLYEFSRIKYIWITFHGYGVMFATQPWPPCTSFHSESHIYVSIYELDCGLWTKLEMINLLILNEHIGSFPGTKMWNNVPSGHGEAVNITLQPVVIVWAWI